MYIIIISGNISFGQDFWIQKDSIKGPPRSGIATFVLGNRGYAVGGLLGNESTRKVFFRKWMPLATGLPFHYAK